MLSLELRASQELSLTLPYYIEFIVKRCDTLDNKPIVFEWSPQIHALSKSGLVLLRHTDTVLEPVPIDHSGLVDISRHGPLIVNGYNQGLWELAPGGVITVKVTLPARYQKLLEPGESYTMLWPGSNIKAWAYGTVRELVGQEIEDKDSSLVLPGGPRVSFSTRLEPQSWPERAAREARIGFDKANQEELQWRRKQNQPKNTFPPQRATKKDPAAPRLKVRLECPPTLREDIVFEVKVKVTYEAEATAQPITFHTYIFENWDNYQLGRLCNGTWENYDDESANGGFRIVDDPDVPVKVGLNERFVSLRPGESWTTMQRLGYNGTELPEDAEHGETFRYIFIGESLDWWDLGLKEDHEARVVKLPCYLFGPVVDPKDNDGRPGLVVPQSNVVEFIFSE
jgi:hypothetical protein